MMNAGEKYKFVNKEVIALVTSGDQVLVFIEKGTVKWVDKSLLQMAS